MRFVSFAEEFLNAFFTTGKHPFVYTNSISVGEALTMVARGGRFVR